MLGNHLTTYTIICYRIAEEMTSGIRRHSPVLDKLYSGPLQYTGSHWDGLQVGDTRQECDVNVCFDVSLRYGTSQLLVFLCGGTPSPHQQAALAVLLSFSGTNRLCDFTLVFVCLFYFCCWLSSSPTYFSLVRMFNLYIGCNL